MALCFGVRGIGAVVYKVPQLDDDHSLKISLRSVDAEDTTPISKAGFMASFVDTTRALSMHFSIVWKAHLSYHSLQRYGGGGHQKASSFMLKCAEFEEWKAQTNSSTAPSIGKQS